MPRDITDRTARMIPRYETVTGIQARPRFGYLLLHVLLRREGWVINWKRVHRLYREEGLIVRLTHRRKRASHLRVVPPSPSQVNER